MLRFFVVGILLSQFGLAPLAAYVRVMGFSGAPLQRRDFLDIRYFVNEQTAPGLRNRDDRITITSDSSPVEAIRAAMDAWTAIGTSQIRFGPVAATAERESRRDGRLVISFADTPGNRSIVQGAVAVTLLFSNVRAELTDTDILFNPDLTFSTTLTQDTFDIQSVAAHELGHALGLDHSGVVGSTMFPVVSRANNSLSDLSSDEQSFATDVYGSEGASLSFADLTGKVLLTTGQPVQGALVTAVDANTNTIVGGITDSEGSYQIRKIPPGNYFVYAEPLDGPTEVSNLGRAGNGANQSFQTDFFGGRISPQPVALHGGVFAAADLTVINGRPALNIEGGGAAPLGEPIRSFVGGVIEPSDLNVVTLYGRGLDEPAISEESISFLGANMELLPDSLQRDSIKFTDGSEFPLISFLIATPAEVPAGLVSVVISLDTETVVFSGGLKVRDKIPAPDLTLEGIVSAASFLPRPVSPGEIISIFGENLGPAAGSQAGVNSLTGWPSTMAASVAVTVNGIPAPLFFVQEDQINAQMPFEVGGASNAVVIVRHKQTASEPVSIPVAVVNPGIFTFAGSSAAVVVNQPSAAINMPSNPAPRGSVITIFGTGQGLVSPPLQTGQLAGGDGELSGTVRGVSVIIGGVQASLTFSGMAPGFTGLWQLNARVPAEVAPGPAVPILVNIDGVSTQPGVTIAVE